MDKHLFEIDLAQSPEGGEEEMRGKAKVILRELLIFAGIITIGYALMCIANNEIIQIKELFEDCFGIPLFRISTNIRGYFSSLIYHNPFGHYYRSILGASASNTLYNIGFYIFFYLYPLSLIIRLVLRIIKKKSV